jgi:hypothetical protein
MVKKLIDRIVRLFSFASTRSPSPAAVAKNAKKKPSATRIGELGEYKIQIQLDQLPKEYRCYNDIIIPNHKSRTKYSQIDHIVITPYAVFVVETKNYSGTVKGSKKSAYWYVNNKFKLYNPLRQNYGHVKALESVLSNRLRIPLISVVSFNGRCTLQVEPELRHIQSNELVVYDIEFSEFVNRKITRLKLEGAITPLSPQEIEFMSALTEQANIKDPDIRSRISSGS